METRTFAFGLLTDYFYELLSLFTAQRADFNGAKYAEHAFADVVPDIMPDPFLIQFFQVRSIRWLNYAVQSEVMFLGPFLCF